MERTGEIQKELSGQVISDTRKKSCDGKILSEDKANGIVQKMIEFYNWYDPGCMHLEDCLQRFYCDKEPPEDYRSEWMWFNIEPNDGVGEYDIVHQESLVALFEREPTNEESEPLRKNEATSKNGIDHNTMLAKKRWLPYKELKSKAAAEAKLLWKNGDERLHHQMTDHLLCKPEFKDLKEKRPALLKKIKEIAYEFGRVKGISNAKK